MAIELDIQRASIAKNQPDDQQLQRWVNTVLLPFEKPFELTIRLVELSEIQQLNAQYRQKDKPTNVLSFAFDVPDGIDLNLLGDIVICSDVIAAEAKEQNKALLSHWAHMVIHGCLHLLGYDHISDAEATEMETLEIKILEKLNINNPYVNANSNDN
jgi:probable rRNA maturation factor